MEPIKCYAGFHTDETCWDCLDVNRANYEYFDFMLTRIQREQGFFEAVRRRESGKHHHNNGEYRLALLTITSIKEMKMFYKGTVHWLLIGGNDLSEATKKAKANIGFYFDEMSFWTRLKWFCFGIRNSDTMWC